MKALEVIKTYFRQIGIHICIIIALSIVLLLAVKIGLSIYTDHGEKKSVPDFRGLEYSKALEVAESENFNLQIVDSIFDTNFEPGTIVDHTPKPGYNVKENRTIFITINSMLPEMISMPDLLNISLRQAQELLKRNGLKMGKIRYSPDVAQNYVLAQMIKGKQVKAGKKIKKGTSVDLLVGMGDSDEDTYVPRLNGLNVKEAIEEIKNARLNIGAKIYEGIFTSVDDSLQAVVKKQTPRYDIGATVKVGTLVDLWLVSKDEYVSSQINDSTDSQ